MDIRVCPALAALCESDQNQETSVPISKFKFTLLTCIYPKDAPTRGIGSAPLRVSNTWLSANTLRAQGAKSCPTAISRPFSRSFCSLLQARVLDSQTFPYLLQMPNGQRPDQCAPGPCNNTPSTGVPPT